MLIGTNETDVVIPTTSSVTTLDIMFNSTTLNKLQGTIIGAVEFVCSENSNSPSCTVMGDATFTATNNSTWTFNSDFICKNLILNLGASISDTTLTYFIFDKFINVADDVTIGNDVNISGDGGVLFTEDRNHTIKNA